MGGRSDEHRYGFSPDRVSGNWSTWRCSKQQTVIGHPDFRDYSSWQGRGKMRCHSTVEAARTRCSSIHDPVISPEESPWNPALVYVDD